jgi:rhodanese-related sulfurtransferase
MVHRRTVLAGAGAALGGVAGCLGGGGGGTSNPWGYETIETDGTAVPLAPLSDVHEWYTADEGRFADARSRSAYRQSHIEGAVFSPAPDGQRSEDPLAGLDPETLVVCYCGCPHHLSSMRAASLIQAGHERVVALDEGFWAWLDAGYPVTGTAADREPTLRVVEGRTDARFAGEWAWARHDPSGQREVAPIADDGTYELSIRFGDVAPDDPIRVTTPDYELSAPLAALTDGVIDPDGRV